MTTIKSNFALAVIRRAPAFCALITLLCSWSVNAYSPYAIATKGYTYGFPIVLMDETFQGLTGPERSCRLGTDVNTFTNVFETPGPDFKAVVRPNVDTLYTSAMLDLAEGPMLMDMPAVADRYVLFALLDAWSNNFAGVGTQTHGDQEGHYVIVGPDWKGDLPPGYQPIQSPTNLVWIVGRTEIKNEADDIALVNDIQRQYQLRPWGFELANTGITGCVPEIEKTPPIEVVLNLSADEYFNRLSRLMAENPPPSRDRATVEALKLIGVGPGAKRSFNRLTWMEKAAVRMGARSAKRTLRFSTELLGITGWGPNPDLIPLGDYGKQYLVRAVVAQVGFGANRGEYAVYQNANRDKNLRILDGNQAYTMTFAADELPPVAAFWSLTVYGDDGFLTTNPIAEGMGIQRYAVGTNSGLVPDDEGNIRLHISHLPPETGPLENWLPTPEGSFQLTIRLYDPAESILKNQWKVPAIVPVK